MTEDLNAILIDGVDVSIRERVSITDPSSSSSGSEGASGSDLDSSHRPRLKMVKAIEQCLKHREGLKW